MPNWYGMHVSVMICVEMCAGGYCALLCKFILKVFVMTNHGKRQFIVRCIYVCIQSRCVIVVEVLCVSVCMFLKFIAQIFRDLTNPGKH